MIDIHSVKLRKGPCNGGASVSSHDLAIVGGEVYGWVEGESLAKNDFVHLETYLRENTPGGIVQILEEQAEVHEWAANMTRLALETGKIPDTESLDIPRVRVNVHHQIFRAGSEIKGEFIDPADPNAHAIYVSQMFKLNVKEMPDKSTAFLIQYTAHTLSMEEEEVVDCLAKVEALHGA